jgi:diguanylate cyclase (GGDEF)-like protein/PAS domain S-box-containing protein
MVPYTENLKQILDSVHDGIYVVDRYRKISYWSRGAERLTGFKSSEALGGHCSELLVHMDKEGKNLCDAGCPVVETMAEDRIRESMLYIRHKDGYRFPVATRVVPSRDDEGKVDGAVVIFGDVTSRFVQVKRTEEAQKILRRDPAAELDNKRDLEISLHMRFDEMQRYGWHFGVLFIDVDDMEKISDLYGYEKGERVLKMIAMTLMSGIRSSDVVGRWSEKQFMVIVGDVNEHQLHFVASRIRMFVESSAIKDTDEELKTTVSIGATLAKSGDTVYTLLKRAEDLMKMSSKGGKNRITIDAEV